MKRSLLYLTIVGATFVTYSGMLWAGRIKCSSMGEQQKYVSDNAQNLKLVLISDLSDANVVWRKKEFGPSLFVAKPVHSSIGWLKRKLSINPPGDGVLGKIMGMVFVYANSGVGNFQEAFMAGDNRVGKLAFDFLGAWTYKLRLSGAPPSKERSFGVGLIAMPGVIWYDWGLQGLVLAAFFHSLLIVLSYWLICSDGFQSLLGYNLAFILFFVEIFSPIVWAPSLMAFPFIVFSLFATSTFLFLRSQWREFLAFDGGIADKA